MDRKAWEVKTNRPEELFREPADYFTKEEIAKYARSAHTERTQRKHVKRILELLCAKPKAKVLDLGCGVGYSTEFLQEEGFNVIGVDILEKALEFAKEKGLKTVQADIRELEKYFLLETFDYVVSTSALQWMKKHEEFRQVGRGISRVLKPLGKVGVHFYPKSEAEMMFFGKILQKAGFTGGIVIDNADSPRKRSIYIIMQKVKRV